jgi:phosphatidylinositol phospholipase C, delta
VQHDDDASEHQKDDDNDDDEEQKVKPNIALQYKHLITIRAGKPNGSLGDALKSNPDKVRRLSLSEQQLAKAAEDHGTDLVRYMDMLL